MKSFWSKALFVVAGLTTASCQDIVVPSDFKVVLGNGGNLFGTQAYVELLPDGRGHYWRGMYSRDTTMDSLSFHVTRKGLQAIYRSVLDNQLFSLDHSYADPNIQDGGYEDLSIEAEGHAHWVTLTNISIPRFRRIANTIKKQLPPQVARHFQGWTGFPGASWIHRFGGQPDLNPVGAHAPNPAG